MNAEKLAALLEAQSGVIRRRQVLDIGGTDNDIERLLRRREWARVHTGVYVDHTGPLSWMQRAWAAVLLHWPAALAGGSALRAHGLARGSAEEVIELVVAGDRHPEDPPGVHTSRATDFDSMTMANLSPPRVRVEHAATTVASEARTDDEAVAVLADACQQRRSTPGRLVETLRARSSLKRRGILLEILEDVASGAYSAMERRYLADVERPHGLPTGARQRRVKPGRTMAYRDVQYLDRRTVVELDGRLGHEKATDRWADLERDIDTAVAGDLTVRIGWRQSWTRVAWRSRWVDCCTRAAGRASSGRVARSVRSRVLEILPHQAPEKLRRPPSASRKPRGPPPLRVTAFRHAS